MTSRSQSQARQLPVQENKTKQDVNFGSKPGKPPGGRGGGGGGRKRDHTNFSSASSNSRRGPPFRGGRGGGGGGGRVKQHQQPHYQQQYRAGLENKYEAVTEADEFEVGSVFKSGSKKQSLNHLLNFQYSSRGSAPENGRRTRENRNSKQSKPVWRPTYSKEQYLQANCQFVVKSSGDYTVHRADPDVPVNWELIEEVHLKTSGTDPLSCPICLFPPTAGKISRCGHVFCWPCILHYLALSDDDWRKCPICYDNIQRGDLKSVQVFQQESLATGKMIEMRLMKRERNSLFSVPVNHPGIQDFQGILEEEENKALSKLVKATPEQVSVEILARERRELEQQYREEQDQPESVFIKEALVLLESRANQCELLSAASSPVEPVKTTCPEVSLPAVETVPVGAALLSPDPFDNLEVVLNSLQDLNVNEEKQSPDGAAGTTRPRFTSSGSDVSSEGEELTDDTAVTAEDLDISAVQPVNLESSASKHAPKSTFYFYQDTGGQLIFLHALNIQMLVHEFGTLEKCPTTIRAKIVEMDSSTMTEDLRERLRYLRHLPVSSSFEVAELELSNILSKQTMAAFKDQIETRKRKRQRKQKAEKVREKRIRREEMRIMGRFPSPMARIESTYHYPKMGETEYDGGSPVRRVSSSESLGSSVSSSGTWAAAGQAAPTAAEQKQQLKTGPGLNFARVTKQAPVQAAAPAPRTAPVQTMVQLGGPMLAVRPRRDSESEAEPEGYVPPPPTASLGDALAQALARADPPTAGNKKKGKKFRGKPISLTGGAPRPMI